MSNSRPSSLPARSRPQRSGVSRSSVSRLSILSLLAIFACTSQEAITPQEPPAEAAVALRVFWKP